MRIGVMTFWTAQDNYGQLLQAYALQRYLREAGHDAFLIRYDMSDRKRTPLRVRIWKALNPVLLGKYLWGRCRARRVAAERRAHPRGFDEFRARHLRFSELLYPSFAELRERPPEADCYIVGSDQVWNFGGDRADVERVRGPVHAFMLDFGDERALRISYAASWSVAALPPALAEEIRPLLARFRYVSVRERQGLELCKLCGRQDAEWVCDPTFLLEPEAYRELYRGDGAAAPRRPYLFLYMLNNGYRFPLDDAYAWAEKRGMEVVYVTGNGTASRRECAYLTIPEWLCCLDGAAAALTNSFHCAVFATLFRRPFGVVPLVGANEGMNSRMESVFAMCGLEERYVRTEADLHWLEKPPEPQMSFDKDVLRRALGDAGEMAGDG